MNANSLNTSTTNTIVGYFATHAQAESAVDALKDAGFQAREVGMAARGGYFGERNSYLGAEGSTVESSDASLNSGRAYAGENTTTTSSRPAVDQGRGFWTKVKDFFEGSTEGGQEAEPYAGESTGDPLASREVTYNDYDTDDIHHSLTGLSVPEQHSRYFGRKFRSGSEGAVVTVTTNDRQDQAREILKRCGADLGENAANYDENTAGYNDTDRTDYQAGSAGVVATDTSRMSGLGNDTRGDLDTDTRNAMRNDTRGNDQLTSDQTIRLYGEVLRVHKDRINRGEVRVRKEVRTDTQTVEVPVTREELVIERRPASGQQAAADAKFGEQEIRIPLTEERASLDKQAVVTEEVRVGKREVSNVQKMNEQVRHEELTVDDSTKTA